MRKVLMFVIGGFGLAGCVGCASVSGIGQLADVSLKPTEAVATPPVLAGFEGDAEITTAEDWQARRVPLLREAFQRDLYGYAPDQFEIIDTQVERVDDDAYDGLAVLDSVTLKVRMSFGDALPRERDIHIAVAKPKAATGPVPTILATAFCPSDHSFQNENLPGVQDTVIVPISMLEPGELTDEEIAERRVETDGITMNVNYGCTNSFSGVIGSVIGPLIAGAAEHSLGRYHTKLPVRESIEQGYAYAIISVSDLTYGIGSVGSGQLEQLSKGAPEGKAWGSLAAWAFQYSRGIDYLETDPALDAERMAIYGHSRYGKAVLLAGALDDRIDAVIAHQSGRGGAALFKSPTGEPIAGMIETYPDWLSKSYQTQSNEEHALPFDQHHLIAMLAPRPVLVGHGRRDGWADPDGAFRAAKGASAAYELYGSGGFRAERLGDFDPTADIAYWMRGGTHGETEEDWEAFFEFLDAHFKTE